MAQTFVEQRQNIGGLAAFEMHQDGGDNLRVFVADKVGGALRLHKVERFNAAGGIPRFEDIFQQAGGTFFTQRFNQHGTQVFVGVDVECGILLKFRQHIGQLFVGNLAHVRHCRTQGLHFTRGEVLKHLCRTVFANGHQQDDAFIGAGKFIAHDRYSSTGE